MTPPGTDREPLHALWGRKLLGIHQAIQGSLLWLRSLRPIGIFYPKTLHWCLTSTEIPLTWQHKRGDRRSD